MPAVWIVEKYVPCNICRRSQQTCLDGADIKTRREFFTIGNSIPCYEGKEGAVPYEHRLKLPDPHRMIEVI